MYAALWRRLPGPTWAKVLQALVLVLAVVAFCFLWLFPRISPLMPFSNNTVDTGSTSSHAALQHALQPAPQTLHRSAS